MANHYEETVLVTAPLMTLVEKMRQIQGFKILSELSDGAGGVVFRIDKGISMATWGHDITVHMSIHDDQRTKVELESKSALKTQVVDWGKNKKNVKEIEEQLFAGCAVETV